MKKSNQTPETSNYGKHYNEKGFWYTLCKAGKWLGEKITYPAVLLYYEMLSPDTPWKAKLEIIGALDYFILPLDLIPDTIPVVGYTDDLEAMRAVVRLTSAYATPEVKANTKRKMEEWFGSDLVTECVAA